MGKIYGGELMLVGIFIWVVCILDPIGIKLGEGFIGGIEGYIGVIIIGGIAFGGGYYMKYGFTLPNFVRSYQMARNYEKRSIEFHQRLDESGETFCKKCSSEGVSNSFAEKRCSKCGYSFCEQHIFVNEFENRVCVYCKGLIKQKGRKGKRKKRPT